MAITLTDLVNRFLDEKAKRLTDAQVAKLELVLSEFIGYAVRQPEKLEGVYR